MLRTRTLLSLWMFAISAALSFGALSSSAIASEYSPPAEEADRIQRLSAAYFEHLDGGEYAEAYALYTAELRAMIPFDAWRRDERRRRDAWGALRRRDRVAVTWYLDPPDSPRPGLYVAVDYVSDYAELAQHTEFLIWYRAKPGDAFELTRHEVNAVAKSEDGRGLPHPGAPVGRIPYPNVDTARAALAARMDARKTDVDGWTVFDVPDQRARWLFTPAQHPAHPSMVLFAPIERNGEWVPGLDIMCGSAPPICQALIEQAIALHERLDADAASSAPSSPPR
ncbi:MAG: DUF4019 domain-containing protein [Lysobacter sp.]|nr:MAG: DUF4019 domain-containing protein [Lysobacter sp.]